MEGKGAYLSTVWPMCDGKGWYLLDRERIYSWLICGFIKVFLYYFGVILKEIINKNKTSKLSHLKGTVKRNTIDIFFRKEIVAFSFL